MTAHKPGQLPKAVSVVAQLPWEVLRHLAGQHLVTHWAKTIESCGYTRTGESPWVVELNYLGTLGKPMPGTLTLHDLGDGQRVRVYRKRESRGISNVFFDLPGQRGILPMRRLGDTNIWVGELEDRGVPNTFFVPAVIVPMA